MLIYELTGTPSNDIDLGQHVKFHNDLNPLLFKNQLLKSDIKQALIEIANHFKEFIGVDLDIQDITISGSNAAYTYTQWSDIDLHLVVTVDDDRMRELLDAKKNVYNTQHDIKVKGIDVELYAQDSNQEHHSQGIYSVLNDKWLSVPKKERPTIDSEDVANKYKNYRDRIRRVLKTTETAVAKDAWDTIKKIRKASLEKYGEFGEENLVYKLLRNQGWIEKLHDHINDLVDMDLSVEDLKL
jgi:hypothetical protein